MYSTTSYNSIFFNEILTSKYCAVNAQSQQELTNHLGNVSVTYSDRKIAVDNDANGIVDNYVADVLSATDYCSFGSEMPGRTFNATDYSFDFNGKPTDRELIDWQDYGERMYMKRLGRFASVDPLFKTYPFYTPYSFAGNKPIIAIDLDGAEEFLQIHYTDQFGNRTLTGTYNMTDLDADARIQLAKSHGLTPTELSKIPMTYLFMRNTFSSIQLSTHSR